MISTLSGFTQVYTQVANLMLLKSKTYAFWLYMYLKKVAFDFKDQIWDMVRSKINMIIIT